MVGNWRTRSSEKLRPGLVGRSRMTAGSVDPAEVLGKSRRTPKVKPAEPAPRKRRRRH